MHRFYHPDPDQGRLDAGESRHARTVLRTKAGDHCAVFDGKGREVHAEIISVTRHEVCFRALSSRFEPEPVTPIHLVQALTKGKSWSLVLEKATELGVTSIHPVLSDRSVSRPHINKGTEKDEKWRQEIIAACKQSGRSRLPRLAPLRSVSAFIETRQPADPGLKLIASLQPGSVPLQTAIREARDSGPVPSATIVVGPEGDFTPGEINRFLSSDYRPVSLGSQVLRAETAGIFLCSVLHYEFG